MTRLDQTRTRRSQLQKTWSPFRQTLDYSLTFCLSGTFFVTICTIAVGLTTLGQAQYSDHERLCVF